VLPSFAALCILQAASAFRIEEHPRKEEYGTQIQKGKGRMGIPKGKETV
jgi:hypothetical protein